MIAKAASSRRQSSRQQVLADCLGLPITVMETAGEGGPWGMAVLAVFAKWHAGETLEDFLDDGSSASGEDDACADRGGSGLGAQEFLAAYQRAWP